MSEDLTVSPEERHQKILEIRAQLRHEPGNVDLYTRLGVELFAAGDYNGTFYHSGK